MHILVVNDDGPPSPHSSPYVHSLVRELQAHGHTVSVCLPHTQRSWIGKAHMIGQTVKPLYYRPPPASAPAAGLVHDDHHQQQDSTDNNNKGGNTSAHGTTHTRPSTRPGTEEWILVDGTPASCVQIGLYHFFRDRGPVDLVVSGPNYGRNTTAVFALSSGTLGGALEAAVCQQRAVALSYAFFSRNHDTGIIQKASRQGVRVIEALVRDWPEDGSVDLYSVNVPLLEGLEEGKVLFTPMLQNYWGPGSCFTEVDGSVDGEEEEEERIRDVEGQVEEEGGVAKGEPKPACHTHKHFKWSPRFTDVYKSVDEAPPGNDGWAVKEGHTSVTPLKANFFQTATQLQGTELQLGPLKSSTFGVVPKPSPATDETSQTQDLPLHQKGQPPVYALIDYGDDYVQPLITSAMESLLPRGSYTLLQPPPTWPSPSPEISLGSLLPDPAAKILQIMPYESIDFDYAATHPATSLVNSYVIRKALIRKHFLSATVDGWVAKHPASALKTHVKRSEAFEVDYAEFLDDALVEAFDLRESLERNEQLAEEAEGDEDDAEKVAEQGAEGKGEGVLQWWILKPSMSDRGQGIRLFSTMEQLQEIFDEWEVESEEEEEEDNEDNEEGAAAAASSSDDDDRPGIMTSHLRHFVAQPYIHPPLLLPEFHNRKFHLRVYVLCLGSLRVYVYDDMLALFAAEPYTPPSYDTARLDAHLTNTCLQAPSDSTTAKGSDLEHGAVHLFSSLPLAPGLMESVKAQIREVTGDLFEAAARGMTVHFQPLPNAFEAYGLDFLVDGAGTAWLLEVNAFPDFRQSGRGPAGGVVDLGRRWG
ncbi:survival protein sure-like phosphatase/nucleotidase [Staphylotrichum tortipilum]|uniref:Survival protein sure-like phosphatase/nucleotidase n=1 Tax=Staphylotrichum tortipilum TaxID=2831512 RepID=A0AAN6MNY5_9PEZI|nr:survival protein sure-like phosphatase/nucleotidase [Staphylotrichum longicolle]